MNEAQYQAHVKKRLQATFPGCVILKTDTSQTQGMPDLVILWHKYWGSLEVKMSGDSPRQPNQEYYVKQLDEMSFSTFIYPENEEEVLFALQQAFEPSRRARVS